MVVQNSYDINPPPGQITISVSIKGDWIDQSRLAELREKLGESANQLSKEAWGEEAFGSVSVEVS